MKCKIKPIRVGVALVFIVSWMLLSPRLAEGVEKEDDSGVVLQVNGVGRLETDIIPTVRAVALKESEWIREAKDLLVRIPETKYALLVKDGRCRPIFVDSEKKKAWTVVGVEGVINDASLDSVTEIVTGEKRIRLSALGGSTVWIWDFDFSRKADGLRVRFVDAGGY